MDGRYAVMGNPIAHSRSPSIHTRFAKQTAESVEYGAILVEPGDFAAAVERFRAGGGHGLNVTVPFKEEAFALASPASSRATRARAVNTLRFGDGEIFGDNTDGVGLVRDLERNLGVSLCGRRLLLVGAGGAARGVLGPLLDSAPQSVTVCNRTAARADELVAHFAHEGRVVASTFGALEGQQFDVVVNATAAGLAGELPALPGSVFATDACGYDMVYGPGRTRFVQWCLDRGAVVAADGLGMLVEQAAESFMLWRGVRPDTQPVIRALRAELG